ncbi:transglutaminase family protein [Luteolibacter sp. Populi]|uniref:transglutaminase-like domain-containing protein n=1 Tax=Luteolibacter sp. Populi TaxID=3230487 RepID=UPI00346785C5
MSRLPKLLLALALLFWGATTRRWEVAVPCALLIPAADWTRLRWDFGEKAALVAWRLSVLFLTIAMVLVLMQGPRLTLMSRVFTWLPVLLLPLQFVQSYGTAGTMSLGAFSMMVRRRQRHAEKYGLPFRDVRFSFDNVFFCATLLASCLGDGADTLWFYPAMILLVAWALIARSGKMWPVVGLAMVTTLTLAALAGLGGQRGLSILYAKVASYGSSSGSSSPSERKTGLGDLGELKQSQEIRWRIIPEKGDTPPRLLRTSSYNRFGHSDPTVWEAILPKDTGNDTNDFKPTDFARDPRKPPDDPDAGYYVCPPNLTFDEALEAIKPELASFQLRGKMDSSETYELMPLPENAASLHRFDTVTQRNSFGTFRADEPPSVCDARVLWDPKFTTERAPWESTDKRGDFTPDLEIPLAERYVIRDFAEEMGLHEAGTVEEKIDALRHYFAQNFRYTRYNSIPDRLHEWVDEDKGVARYVQYVKSQDRRATLLSVFLEDTKAGHCEFFATTAALLLREAGVPTRYTSGFVVVEQDPRTREYVVRGTHAHAWCRAWDEENQRWWDVDVTPSSWISAETPRPLAFQGLRDRFQMLREDLVVWRDQPGHMMIITLVLLAPVAIGLAFVGRKLWRSRKRVEMNPKRGPRSGALQTTPLASLEKAARRILGERPAGTPVGSYLMPLAVRLPDPALLGEALKLHHRLRFDPQEKNPALIGELQFLVAEIRRQLGAKGARASART